MAPKYRLVYFNVRGRAETSRLILALAGVDYEDVRISFDDWPKIKPTTPNGTLPVLEVTASPVRLSESIAIARYLAKEHGLAGNGSMEQARADMIVDIIQDWLPHLTPIYKEQDPVKKEEMRAKVENEVLPQLLQSLEKILIENKKGDGYLVGDTVTWADLHLQTATMWSGTVDVKMDWSPCPKLQALVKRVEAIPAIEKWLKTRPVTPR